LRRLPQRDDAGFSAFAVLGENIVWAETNGAGAGRLWTADVRQPAARQVTADLGATSFAGSPHDLVLAESRIHWAAAATDGLRTEVRSVALAGGRVDVRPVDGRWTLSTWPWLTDHQEGTAGSSRLLNLHTGQETPVRTSEDDDLAECDPPSAPSQAPEVAKVLRLQEVLQQRHKELAGLDEDDAGRTSQLKRVFAATDDLVNFEARLPLRRDERRRKISSS
jgi:hypothetical protein